MERTWPLGDDVLDTHGLAVLVGTEGAIGRRPEAQPELSRGLPEAPQVPAILGEMQMRKCQQPWVLSSESVATLLCCVD